MAMSISGETIEHQRDVERLGSALLFKDLEEDGGGEVAGAGMEAENALRGRDFEREIADCSFDAIN